MVSKQEQAYRREKYAEAVRQAYRNLQVAEPQLSGEEYVKRLRTTVRIPKTPIPSGELETICRATVNAVKPTASIMLPRPSAAQPKRVRLADEPEPRVREAEIDWAFLHPSEVQLYGFQVPYGLEELVGVLRRHVRRLQMTSTSPLEFSPAACLVTGVAGSGKTSLLRYIAAGVDPGQTSILDLSGERLNACNKIDAVLSNLEDFLETAATRPRALLVLLDDLDVLLPSEKKGKDSDLRRKQTTAYRLERVLRRIAEMYPASWVLGSCTSRSTIEATFLERSPFVIKSYVIPPLTHEARRSLVADALRKYAEALHCAVDIRELDLEGAVKGTEGWSARQICKLAEAAVVSAFEEGGAMTAVDEDEVSVIESTKDSDEDIVLRTVVEHPCGRLSQQHIESGLQAAALAYTPEGFMNVPEVTLDDVGGLTEVKHYVTERFVDVMRNLEIYRQVGLQDSSGLLMWGPPGCGKTHLAKAIANACEARFILVNGSELLDKYVGASERKLIEVFERARDNQPCLIFFDEFDALCPSRSQDGLHEVSRRVVNVMLTELDGVRARAGVFVCAATNEPSLIDPAVLRSGRFEHKLFVPPPDAASRADIIRVLCRNKPWSMELADVQKLADMTEGYTGADLKFLLNQTAQKCWLDAGKPNTIALLFETFKECFRPPSISPAMLERYSVLGEADVP